MIKSASNFRFLTCALVGMTSACAIAAGTGPTLQQLQDNPQRYAGAVVDLHICVDNGMHGVYVRDCAADPVTTSVIGLSLSPASEQARNTFKTLFGPLSGPSYEMRVVGTFKLNNRIAGDHWGTATSIVATSIVDARPIAP